MLRHPGRHRGVALVAADRPADLHERRPVAGQLVPQARPVHGELRHRGTSGRCRRRSRVGVEDGLVEMRSLGRGRRSAGPGRTRARSGCRRRSCRCGASVPPGKAASGTGRAQPRPRPRPRAPAPPDGPARSRRAPASARRRASRRAPGRPRGRAPGTRRRSASMPLARHARQRADVADEGRLAGEHAVADAAARDEPRVQGRPLGRERMWRVASGRGSARRRGAPGAGPSSRWR